MQHKIGSSTHPECPPGYVLLNAMPPVVATNIRDHPKSKWTDMVFGGQYEHEGPKVPVFVPKDEFDEKCPFASKIDEDEVVPAALPEPISRPGPKARKPRAKKPEKAEKPRMGPKPGSMYLRRLARDYGIMDITPEKKPLPKMVVNDGIPREWEEIPDDGYFSLSVTRDLRVQDGRKTHTPGTIFREGNNIEMIQVRCPETEEVMIIRKDEWLSCKAVIGLDRKNWERIASNPEKELTLMFPPSKEPSPA